VIAEAIRKHPEMGRVRARWTHHHLLLLHDRSEALEEFYRALILSNRKKVFVGPAILSGAAELLRCEHHIEAPLRNAFQQYQAVNDSISNANGDVLLFCAGLASKVWIADEATRRPSSTLIDLGSALDPLFIGRTRSIPQPDKAEAQEFFEHALNGVTA